MGFRGSSSDDTAGWEAQWPHRSPGHQLSWLPEWQQAEAWWSMPGGDGRASGELGVGARSREMGGNFRRWGRQRIESRLPFRLLPLTAFNHSIDHSVSMYHFKILSPASMAQWFNTNP